MGAIISWISNRGGLAGSKTKNATRDAPAANGAADTRGPQVHQTARQRGKARARPAFDPERDVPAPTPQPPRICTGREYGGFNKGGESIERYVLCKLTPEPCIPCPQLGYELCSHCYKVMPRPW